MNWHMSSYLPQKFHPDPSWAQNRLSCNTSFAIDLAARCQAEFNQAFGKFGKNVPKLKSVLSYTCDSVVDCYHGNHDL